MYCVLVTRDPGYLFDHVVRAINTKLTEIVVDELRVEGGDKLATARQETVEILVRDVSSMDAGFSVLSVTILANEHPERRKNLDSRLEKIVCRVREFLVTMSRDIGFLVGSDNATVRLILSPMSFSRL